MSYDFSRKDGGLCFLGVPGYLPRRDLTEADIKALTAEDAVGLFREAWEAGHVQAIADAMSAFLMAPAIAIPSPFPGADRFATFVDKGKASVVDTEEGWNEVWAQGMTADNLSWKLRWVFDQAVDARRDLIRKALGADDDAIRKVLRDRL